jgi:hypothetical protein
MTADIIVYALPFGGMAFEPITLEGEDWLDGYCANMGGAPFTNEDACMAEFSDAAAGFEPFDAGQVAMDATLAGFVWERGS